jgi:nicotinamide-nucleotide amidase
MKIGFLIIGSEVLDGKISDLNTKLLADFLRLQHLEINEAYTARDERNSIRDALEILLGRSDLVISTGGLGPTKDDMTKQTIAEFLGRDIKYSEDSFKVSEENYQRLNRQFPGKEHGYCFLPEGFKALSNSTGFAPGLFTEHSGKFIFSAPGVPREFKSMLDNHLMDLIAPKVKKNNFIDRVIIRTKYVPEEKIFSEVDPKLWEKLEAFGEVSSLPVLMGVDIGVKVKGTSLDDVANLVSKIKAIVNDSPVKAHVWSYGPESLEEQIVVLANLKKIKFGFAESATGGLCSNRITNISGSSQCFMGSVVCYDEKIKQHILGVNPKTLSECTAVSIKCAEEMAQGLSEKFSLDIAISITGYAGPGGGNDQFPVGSVCIGKALKNSPAEAQAFHFNGDREIVKQRFAQAALHTLLEELENFA